MVLGRGETPKPKPYAESLDFIAEQLEISIDEVVFVGDNHIDASTAKNAGCSFIGVRTGPRGDKSWAGNPPDILINSVKNLIEVVELKK
jgi:phosphoglycolate phosphatase